MPRSHVDYDLHGIVSIRVFGAGVHERAGLERDLGLQATNLDRTPDLTIRFERRLQRSRALTFLSEDCAFAGEAFLLTAGRDRRPVMQIPFADLGSDCELLVARGMPHVPLLIPIVNLTALAKGHLPIHASGFILDGVGTLIAGGAGAGKTGLLLAFMLRGASFIGDDWVLVGGEDGLMRGLATPIEIKGAYLKAMPEYSVRLGGKSLRQRVIEALIWAERQLPDGAMERSLVARRRARVRALLEAKMSRRAKPARLFGAQACRGSGPVHVVCLARSVSNPEIEVRAIAPDSLVGQLVPLVEHEWVDLDRRYRLYRSAFPERSNRFVEEKGELLRGQLTTVLAHKRTFAISYPSPAPVEAVYRLLVRAIKERSRWNDPRSENREGTA